MTNYERGRAAEYKVVKRLREQGALIAQRSAGSHSPVDIWAVFPDHMLLVQVKKDDSPHRLDDFHALPVPAGVIKQLWHFTSKGLIVSPI